MYGIDDVNWGGGMNEETEGNGCVSGCGKAMGEYRTWAPGHDLKAVSLELDRLVWSMSALVRALRKTSCNGVQDD